MGVYRRIFYPLRDVAWLEPLVFQEELVKSPTFHNFADPILDDIVVKDVYAWVYLVNTEQITNRASLQIIEIGYNGSVMDRYLFNVEVGNWEVAEEQKTILCGGGAAHTALSMRYPERRWTSPFALIGM